MRSKSRRGSNAVEFALTVPWIAIILSGLIDFGWYINQSVLLQDAIRDAVRMGATTDPGTSAVSKAATRITAACTANGVKGTPKVTTNAVSGTGPVAGSKGDEQLKMVVEVPFTPLFGMTPGLPKKLNASLAMRLEYQY